MIPRVLAIVGTRPDALKMAPVILELRKRADCVFLSVAATGQHREMLDQVLRVFDIKPDHDLAVMQERQTLSGLTQRILLGLDELISTEEPHIILAQGDTTTTFVASLAAFYHRIAFGHVEAGLRTDNKHDPFPEEINRRLTSVLADLHFAPTPLARQNLLANGVSDRNIYVTGNTVIDALLMVEKRPYESDDSEIRAVLDRADRVVLVTAHRRENWGEPMRHICAAIREMPKLFPGVEVIFPVHRNPIVRDVVFPELFGKPGVTLIEPPEYVPFVHLMKRSYLILTDSGGVQEEAPSLGKPVLVLRNTTERPEGVEAGTAKLVGTETEDILREAGRLLSDPAAYAEMARVANPYGDGHAAERICAALLERLPMSP